MSFWSGLKVSWQAYKTRRKMNRQFGKREDPFAYRTTPYEAARLEAMEKALGTAPLGTALEVGCAEGHFTEKLARRSGRVIALDISSVALERARKRAPAAFIEADLMTWEPGLFAPVDAIVLGDVRRWRYRREGNATGRRAAKDCWLPNGNISFVHP